MYLYNYYPQRQNAIGWFIACDSADCKQRGTKWSAEGAERVPSQPVLRKPLSVKNLAISEKNYLSLIIENIRYDGKVSLR